MAHMKPNESLGDEAPLSTVSTPKSHSRTTDGELGRISSSFPYREVTLHSQNDLTMSTANQTQLSVRSDGNPGISSYSKETEIKTPSEIFRYGAENSSSYTSPSSRTEARHSSFHATAAENLNTSFQVSALTESPKQSDKFRLGNNSASTNFDALEHRDHVLGLETSRDDRQETLDNKQLSKSQPVTVKDVETLQERIQILQQNCEHTMQQLFQKEEENLKLKNEVTKLSEMELRLKRECDRLRTHLVETEDRYTQEALEAEEREERLRKSFTLLKEQMSSSSADGLNARSNAMKQVESLRSQLNSMMEERDDALQKLADVEETCSSYSSSLVNLQSVLEQFQDERQSHQMVELDKCRRDLVKERLISQQLQEKIDGMQVKLDELSSAPATVRQLKQQLSENEREMVVLQAEVQAQKTELLLTKANLQRFSAVSEDKIDRPLVRNLLLGFIHTPPTKRDEAFRVVGHILGFTDEELKEIGVSSSGSWINGLYHRNSTSSAVNLGSDGRSKIMDRSFFELFVRFLEKESTPLPSARLPTERMVQEQQEKLNRSSSLSVDGPTSPPPLLPPLTNQFPTATSFQSISANQFPTATSFQSIPANQFPTATSFQSVPVFQMHQSTNFSVPDDMQTVTTSTHTETQRTEIPTDPSASRSDS